jgi:hypothetical protein
MPTKQSNEVRNQLHTLQVENLTPAQIESAAGGVYLSRNEDSTLLDTQSIVKSFQAVKLPTLGALIPNTCVIVSRTADSGILPLFTPIVNKSYVLYAADVLNSGGVPGEINLGYTNAANDKFVTIKAIGANPGATTAFEITPVFFDSGAPIGIRMTSGTASDHTVSILYGEVVQ